jgi:hypothetical protein
MAEGDATLRTYVDPTDMLRWTHSVDGIERKVNAAIVDGVNHYGEMVVRNWAEQLAESTGLEPGAVLRLIVVKPARSGKHEFTADASAIKNANPQWMRPWVERDHAEFEQDTLVKIVTSHDESTCEVCLEAERNGPYTMRQIKDMAAKWGHFQGKGGKGEATNLLHPNAVLQGSRFIGYGHVTEMVRAVFSADAVTAETTVGRFTIGPRHPILTRRGFIRACDLTEGDELLYDRRCEGSVIGPHVNFDQVPLVENAFAALAAKGDGAQTRFATADDLHGDAIFCQDKVDVIRAARPLLAILNPAGLEQFSELGLPRADVNLAVISRLSGERQFLQAAFAALGGLVRGGDLPQALAFAHAGPFNPFLLRAGSQWDALLRKPGIDRRSAYIEPLSKSIDALARFVEQSDCFRWDKVVRVSFGHFEGLAFDATTETGLYNSDGYVVHNCRCVVQPFTAVRRLPVSFGTSVAPKVQMTARQLGEVIAGELKLKIKVTK